MELFFQRATRSKATPVMHNAMGKWTSTTCCACFAYRTDPRSKGFMAGLGYLTTTLPVIFGCMEQKYGYCPARVNVKENLSSLSRTLDLKVVLSSLTTVCGISSRLVHVTVVPAEIVSSVGPKLKLSILTSV